MPIEILIPAVYLTFLTFLITALLAFGRLRAVFQREVKPKYYLLYEKGEETASLRKLSRHYANLYELPVSFYFLTVLAFITAQSSTLLLTLFWLFALLRTVHTIIHIGPNHLLIRFSVFAVGYLVLVLAWVAWVWAVWG